MLNLPTALKEKIEGDIGIDPIIVVSINWGPEDTVYYSNVEGTYGNNPVYGYVENFGSFELTTHADGFGESNTIEVVFSDVFGHFKQKFDGAKLYDRDRNCSVYMGESSVNDLVKLFDGVIESVDWNDKNRTFSVTIVNHVEDETINYSPSLLDIDDSDPNKYFFEKSDGLNTQEWPQVFGTVKDYTLQGKLGNPISTKLADPYQGKANDASHTLILDDGEVFPFDTTVDVLLTGNYSNRFFAIICKGKRTTENGGHREEFVILKDDFNIYAYEDIRCTRIGRSTILLNPAVGSGYEPTDPIPWLAQSYLFFRNTGGQSYSGGFYTATSIAYCLNQENGVCEINKSYRTLNFDRIEAVQRMWPTAWVPGTVIHTGSHVSKSVGNWTFLLDRGTEVKLYKWGPSRQFVVDSKENTKVFNLYSANTDSTDGNRLVEGLHYEVKSTNGADANKLWTDVSGSHPPCTYVELRHDAMFANMTEYIATKEGFIQFDSPRVSLHNEYYQQKEVMKYLCENFSNYEYKDVENNRACNFVLHSSETFSSFVTSFAWQNAQGVKISNGKITLSDLSFPTPIVAEITADDIIHKSLILGTTDISSVKTDMEVEHQSFDYLIEPRVIKTKENIDIYGVQEHEAEIYTTNEPDLIVDFWKTRLSSQYKTVTFRTSFKHLALEVWDRVRLNLDDKTLQFYDTTEGTPLVNYHDTVNSPVFAASTTAIVVSKEVDFNDRTVLITLRTGIPVGSYYTKNGFFRNDLKYVDVDSKLTQFRTQWNITVEDIYD